MPVKYEDLRLGDIAVVRVRIDGIPKRVIGNDDPMVSMSSADRKVGGGVYIRLSEIVSIESRPMMRGDRVEWMGKRKTREKPKGTLVAMQGDRGWVDWDNDREREPYVMLTDVRRIDDE